VSAGQCRTAPLRSATVSHFLFLPQRRQFMKGRKPLRVASRFAPDQITAQLTPIPIRVIRQIRGQVLLLWVSIGLSSFRAFVIGWPGAPVLAHPSIDLPTTGNPAPDSPILAT
jgi:hypothetical protein